MRVKFAERRRRESLKVEKATVTSKRRRFLLISLSSLPENAAFGFLRSLFSLCWLRYPSLYEKHSSLGFFLMPSRMNPWKLFDFLEPENDTKKRLGWFSGTQFHGFWWDFSSSFSQLRSWGTIFRKKRGIGIPKRRRFSEKMTSCYRKEDERRRFKGGWFVTLNGEY